MKPETHRTSPLAEQLDQILILKGHSMLFELALCKLILYLILTLMRILLMLAHHYIQLMEE